MKYLKKFNESSTFTYPTDPDEIREILLDLTGNDSQDAWFGNRDILERCQIEGDGTVNVLRGDIVICYDPSTFTGSKLNSKWRESERLPIKFGRVDGSFVIMNMDNLTTLEGCPHTCHKFVVNRKENLKNLVGGPDRANTYDVKGSGITSLKGGPTNVDNLLIVGDTPLQSLEGCPDSVKCISVYGTLIKNYKGLPDSVEIILSRKVPNLTSLEGIPKSIQHLDVKTLLNTLKDPRDLKDSSLERLCYRKEPFIELVLLFEEKKKIEGRHGLEFQVYEDGALIDIETTRRFVESLDYNWIRGTTDKPHINLFRLKEALSEFGIRVPNLTHIFSKTLHYYDFLDEEGSVVNFDGKRYK